jgi:cytochrome c556
LGLFHCFRPGGDWRDQHPLDAASDVRNLLAIRSFTCATSFHFLITEEITMKQPILVAGVMLSLLVPGMAHAQFAKTEDAIKYRAATFVVMGNHFSRIGAVVKGEKPFDKNEVAANAAVVASMAQLPWQAFGPGTEGGKSLPEIWKEMDKFKAGSEKMQKAVAELNTAAKSGNLETIKIAFGEAGKSCKACHDNYRKK